MLKNIKRIAYISLPILSGVMMVGPAFADDPVTPITVNGGNIQFTGSIVNAPCVIDNNSASAIVKLGQYRVDSFSGTGSTSSPVDFNIDLIDCTVDTYSKAAITLNGVTADGNNKVLALKARQAADTTAGGVGIQILQDGKALPVDGSTASTPKPFTESGVSLLFQAQYLALADEVTPGSANSSADFTITYQ
ncbi:fimbrial protein [Enterobacter hormaechei]|uniref:fimbrial protein n=1 Tax=Enterobacter hormaechei TaxID=158836 RepID=UPI00188A8BC4|nr:fimbrial protein [Enterobacter hormaechei]MBF4154935.1 fimbrial protein [Enterobacter hormaechei]